MGGKIFLELKQNTSDCHHKQHVGTGKNTASLSFVHLPRGTREAQGVFVGEKLFYLNLQGHIYVGHVHTFY